MSSTPQNRDRILGDILDQIAALEQRIKRLERKPEPAPEAVREQARWVAQVDRAVARHHRGDTATFTAPDLQDAA